MKKRLFSLLLSLCVVAGLFAGMTTTAFADGETIQATLERGDTVAALCDRLGINFNANREWITKTNKISNYAALSVGTVLTLPAPGTVLQYVEPTTTNTETNTAAATSAATTTTTTNGVATVQYTLQPGDYLLKICHELGIDFAANQEWIKAANNITNFNNLKVGRVLTLPAPGTTPALNTANTSTANTATAANTAAAAATATTGLLAGDTVSYYMTSHMVSSGETLFNICQYYGANMESVQKLNNISNAASLKVGQILSIPSTVVPQSGSYVTIVSHKIVAGDTVMNLCKSYGIDYGKSAAQIKALNNRDNLDAIKVGQTLLLPVTGTAATGNTTTVPATTTTVVPVSNGTGTSGTTYYTMNKTGAANGTYALTVNGQAVNSANAGQTVHVVTTPDYGYKVGGISVVRDYNSTVVDVDSGNNFVMPDCNVRIVVTFVVDDSAQPHVVNNSSVTDQSVISIVNGVNKTSVEAGQTVRLALNALPIGKSVAKIVVSTVNPVSRDQVVNGQLEAAEVVALAADNSFTMPGSNVYVTVILQDA